MNPSPLQQATHLHQSGRPVEAAALYQRLLSADPRNARLHYLLAASLLQAQQGATALPVIERAIALDPRAPDHHAVHGHILKALGRLDDAIACYRQAVRLKPSYAEMQANLGNALQQLAVSQADTEALGEAVECYRRALRVKPLLAGAHNNLGHALRLLGRHGEAIVSFRRALQLTPADAGIEANLGAALADDGQIEAAVEVLARAAARAPALATWLQLGLALARLRRWDQAIAAFAEVLRREPDNLAALNGQANAMVMAGRFDAADDVLRSALRLAPAYPPLLNNLAYLRTQTGRFDEATTALEQALAIDPDNADACYGLSTELLRAGAYGPRAWDLLESRWAAMQVPRKRSGAPWSGEPLGDRVLLLDGEQGSGDIIQFCRYATLAAALATTVILVMPAALRRLMLTLAGPAQVLTDEDPTPAYDAHAPLCSLPRAFATDLATIPATGGYLAAEADAVSRWRSRLATLPGLRVGLVWAGNPGFLHAHWRDVPATALARLAAIDGVSFVSLQKRRPAQKLPAQPLLHDWTEELLDFADTAALISTLDLVIGCDTGVMHLAGALGVPAWIMHRANPDWRWYPRSAACVWYDSVRQFWQPSAGDWDSVVEEVAHALHRVVVDGKHTLLF